MAEIVDVYYEASDGSQYYFQMHKTRLLGMCGTYKERPVRIKTANFHNWSFTAETQMLEQGVRPLRFYKRPASYQTKIYISGSTKDRKKIVDAMHGAFERDVRLLMPGKLFWREYYVECFIDSSSTYPLNGENVTVNDISIYCPYPFWIKEEAFDFAARDPEEDAPEFLDFPYGFEYDFTPRIMAAGEIENGGTAPAQMEITFYGPAENPYVEIGGNRYGVIGEIYAGESVIINTKTKTVRRKSGTENLNYFDFREKTGHEFDPVPLGIVPVSWTGEYALQIRVLKERSEPAWT